MTYVTAGGCWILFSDKLLSRLVSNPSEFTQLSIYKGWAFVVLTGGLLYSMLRRWLRQLEQDAEKLNQAEAAGRETGEKLRQSEEQLRLCAEHSPAAVAMFDRDMKYLVVSRRWREDYGLGDQPLVGRSHYEVFPEIPAQWKAIHQRCLAGAVEKCEEEEFRRANGQSNWIRWEIRSWHLGDGSIGGIIIFSEDISARKQSQQRILQLNRIYAVLSDVNQCIVREKDSKVMLAAACRIAVEKGQLRMAWIALFNPATQLLEPVTSAGVVDGYTDFVNIDLRDESRRHGPAASSFLGNQHSICNDLESDPNFRPWREEALRRGYRSAAGFPLRVEGKVVGVFTLYAATPQFFDSEEVHLLDELAMDIGFALEVSRLEGQRQRIEQELRASEERYKVIFENAPGAVLLVAGDGDDMGRILAANERAARMHGYLPGELVGKRIEELSKIDSEAAKMENFRRIAAGESVTVEVEHYRKDGTVFPVEIVASQLVLGGRVCVLSFETDITERKRVEEAHARLAIVVEQASETIVITDTRGTILYANPAFEKSTGYTRAEAIGRNPRLLKSGKQNDKFYQQMWEVLERGEAWHGHFINRRKDGTLYEEDATISPVRDMTGNTISYVAVKRDVTREVQLETQLLQSQKMESVGQLAGGVAHDFNNMLAATMMHLSLLQGNPDLSPETQETIQELIEGAKRAANLTRQLLMFSRRSVMEVKLLDLNELVTNLLKMLGRLIGEHIVVRFDRREGLPPIAADPGMIEQVVMNLAVNARDAMPKGGGLAIAIEAVRVGPDRVLGKPGVEPGQFLCLSVADNGCGMDEALRQRIFEPFFTTKEPGKGTGLGLATVHGIVAQHKGWVEVESEVGQGTTFKVFLPASLDQIPETMPDLKSAAMRGHETILVVEDEEEVRGLVAETLRTLGYTVFDAENGQAAVNLWQQRNGGFDLLFSDMVMPEGLTGLDLAEKLKKEKPPLNVIISSGYSADIAGQSKLSASGITYLQKPYQLELLSKVVRNCLDGKK